MAGDADLSGDRVITEAPGGQTHDLRGRGVDGREAGGDVHATLPAARVLARAHPGCTRAERSSPDRAEAVSGAFELKVTLKVTVAPRFFKSVDYFRKKAAKSLIFCPI